MKTTLSITAAIAVGFVGYVLWPDTDQPTPSQEVEVAVADKALVDIVIPDTLSVNAQIGKRGFEANCATCHGTNAVGQDGVAPPLIHIIYEPSHHGDESFQRAVAMGVRGHHWPFGSMPPIEGLNRGDVTMITAYIREVQRANGIN
ncbi:cytochrome c [uncultured Tateyamaria sp.]|uniref:c-type cytochrome n=1 Tax=uncultured Tateyamaria sp. TaxID=455651 RepID=UPI0026334BFD|nr:cytochrome c [uncultured Tateyamaria sp.]